LREIQDITDWEKFRSILSDIVLGKQRNGRQTAIRWDPSNQDDDPCRLEWIFGLRSWDALNWQVILSSLSGLM